LRLCRGHALLAEGCLRLALVPGYSDAPSHFFVLFKYKYSLLV
jgi:hypothetical protein